MLNELAEQTGGREYAIENVAELPDIAAKIGIELRNEYILGYTPKSRARRQVPEGTSETKPTARTAAAEGLFPPGVLCAYSIAPFAAALFAACLCAQFRSDTRLVVLHASVTDRKGKLLTNLDQHAFKIFENGQPQQIKIFRREDVPVSLGIVIDDSGSMSTKRSRVEAAALAMVRESNPQDEVCVVNFNDDAYLDVPFTNDIHKMEQGLARIDSRGGTAMRDALNMSLDYTKDKAKKDKKVLLVITDGNDNASNVSLESVVRHSNQATRWSTRLGSSPRRRSTKRARRAAL